VPIRPSVPSDDDEPDEPDRPDEPDHPDPALGPLPWSSTWDGTFEPVAASPPAAPPPTDVQFHADKRFMWLKFVAAAVFIASPFVARSSVTGIVIGLVVGLGLAVYGLRDVLAPVRLAVDPAGVTVVAGFAGHRRLPWSAIDRVRLDERSRYGGRQSLLEIDAGESLHFFSRYDLGMPPTEALDRVRAVRDRLG
jgi:hypothetical protein